MEKNKSRIPEPCFLYSTAVIAFVQQDSLILLKSCLAFIVFCLVQHKDVKIHFSYHDQQLHFTYYILHITYYIIHFTYYNESVNLPRMADWKTTEL